MENKLKIVNKVLTVDGVKGIYAVKVDTTPDDPDYGTIKLGQKMFDDGYKIIGLIKEIRQLGEGEQEKLST